MTEEFFDVRKCEPLLLKLLSAKILSGTTGTGFAIVTLVKNNGSCSDSNLF